MNVFVFGSNLAGRHGAGAALFAKKHHGAIYGVGEGIQGNSYGIPTKDSNIQTLPIESIRGYVDNFLKFAGDNPQCNFNVTAIGCGLAGYTPEDIAPLFKKVIELNMSNCQLPTEFLEVFAMRSQVLK